MAVTQRGGLAGVADVLAEISAVLRHGDQKYGERSWAKSDKGWSRHADAARRHIDRWLKRQDPDESGHSHVVHAIARLMIVRQMQLEKLGKDDRP